MAAEGCYGLLTEGLFGAHPSWRAAGPGLETTLLRERVANPIVFVDEFDKTGRNSANPDPYRPFYTTLEPAGARRLVDEILGFPTDASHVMWAMAANSTSDIPEAIIDRLTVVEVPSPDPAALAAVARSIYAEANAAEARINPGSTVHAEARSWGRLLYVGLDVRRINHQDAYSNDAGVCTNQIENFFSRFRRAEIGIHYHFAGPYLADYASEMTWREDARRIDNGTQVRLMTLAGLTTGPSALRGYWQRHLKGPATTRKK